MKDSFLFTSQKEDKIREFYLDIVQSSIFESQISYLSKYDESELKDYAIVVYGEYILKKIVGNVIKAQANKLSQIKQIVTAQIQSTLTNNQQNDNNSNSIQQNISNASQQQQINSIITCISQEIFNRLEQIKGQYILNSLALGSSHLIDVNWKIVKTISSEGRSFIGQKPSHLFKLTLYLKENSLITGSETKTVSLQLTKVHLKQLIGQLKSLKNEL